MRRLVACILLALPVVASGFARPAAAATGPAPTDLTLVSSDPAAGDVVEEAPEHLVLRFDAPVDQSTIRVRVLSSEGDAVTTGPVQASGPGESTVPAESPTTDGPEVSVSLPGLDDGAYVVAWNAPGAAGGLYFWVDRSGQGAVEVRAGVEAGPDDPVALRAVRGVARFAGWLAVVVLVGIVAAAALGTPPTAGRRWFRRVIWTALGVAAVAATIGFLAEGLRGTGLGAGSAFRPERWRETLETTEGAARLVRLLLLGMAMPLVAWVSGSGEPAARSVIFRACGGVVGIALLASVVVSGDAVGGLLPDPGLGLGLAHIAALTVLCGALLLDLVAAVEDDRPRRISRVLAVASTVTVLATATIAAREPYPAPAAPDLLETELHAPIGDGELDLTVTPARIGLNEMHLYLFAGSGRPADTESAGLTVSLPSEEIGPITVPLVRIVASHYSAYSVPLPLPGYWEMRITTVGGADGRGETTATLEVP